MLLYSTAMIVIILSDLAEKQVCSIRRSCCRIQATDSGSYMLLFNLFLLFNLSMHL